MQAYALTGPTRLSGEITIHGAKNSALPILAATVLCRGRCTLRNIPDIEDICVACRILRLLGAQVQRQGDTLLVDTTDLENRPIPAQLAGKMRASILFLGALMGRCGKAEIALPGGCPLGERPVDLHLSSLQSLGARITVQDCLVSLSCPGAAGGRLELPIPSVGATENILLAACLGTAQTVICGAAKEPEIMDLAHFLQKAGARICGVGTNTITVHAVPELSGVTHTVISDRIEAGTYLCACAGCGGDVTLRHADASLLTAVTEPLQAAGCRIEAEGSTIRIRSSGALLMPPDIETQPYPGFPTDAQPVLMAALLRSEGECRFRETIFPRRFAHAVQMQRLGADITLCGDCALLRGGAALHGASVQAQDLRGGAALLIACMSAEGKSVVTGVKHVERGYDNLEKGLAGLGAQIKKVEI